MRLRRSYGSLGFHSSQWQDAQIGESAAFPAGAEGGACAADRRNGMAGPSFEPEKALGKKLTEMDKQELCMFVSALCRTVVAEVGSRGRRGGLYPENISVGADGAIAEHLDHRLTRHLGTFRVIYDAGIAFLERKLNRRSKRM